MLIKQSTSIDMFSYQPRMISSLKLAPILKELLMPNSGCKRIEIEDEFQQMFTYVHSTSKRHLQFHLLMHSGGLI